MGTGNGAFRSGPTDQSSAVLSASSTNKVRDDGDGIDFKASYGNSIYSGSRVQVNALQIFACIRI